MLLCPSHHWNLTFQSNFHVTKFSSHALSPLLNRAFIKFTQLILLLLGTPFSLYLTPHFLGFHPTFMLTPQFSFAQFFSFFFFLKIFFFFWCGPFSKSLLNLLQYCFCFLFWIFGPEACGIFAPWPGIEHAPPALEGKVLTTGPPGKFHSILFFSELLNIGIFPIYAYSLDDSI